MTVGVLNLAIFIENSNSLKEKRMVLHSLKARLRNNFNVAVTQAGDEDKWQKATLAVVGIEKNRQNMNRVLSRAVNFIATFRQIVLIDYEIDLL